MDDTTGSGDDLLDAANHLQASLNEDKVTHVLSPMNPVEFEKDDDTNGHIDFLSTAANLRGVMYNIESIGRLVLINVPSRF
nr:ubiquitin-like modifier-activating enzyme 6 [Crassostrea gigas]